MHIDFSAVIVDTYERMLFIEWLKNLKPESCSILDNLVSVKYIEFSLI